MKNKSVLMRVLADIGRSRALIAVSLLLSAASVVFNLYIPVLAGDAIDRNDRRQGRYGGNHARSY